MRESKIETEVCDYAISLGWYVLKFISPGLRGVPDRLFLRNGIAIFIEFKATDKTSRKQQLKRQKELRESGFDVYEVDNIEYGKEIFNNYEIK